MIRRTMDAAFLNSVVNHPEVRPWLGGDAPIDLGPALSDARNVALVSDLGGFFMEHREPGLYEVHTQFLPEGRGRHALKCVWEAMRYMFVQTDCTRLLTRIPVGNHRTLAFAAAVGWPKIFERKASCEMPNGSLSDVHYYAFDFDDWRARDKTLRGRGQWFHKRLESAKAAAGSVLPVHDDDHAHDAAVGASVLMMQAGNANKAAWLYNRWALHAGYAPIRLLNQSPVIVDVVDAVVEVRNGDMEVLLCR